MAIIHKRTIYKSDKSETTLSVFGVAVYKRTVIENRIEERNPIGFNIYPSDAPSEIIEDDEEVEEFTLEPYATARPTQADRSSHTAD